MALEANDSLSAHSGCSRDPPLVPFSPSLLRSRILSGNPRGFSRLRETPQDIPLTLRRACAKSPSGIFQPRALFLSLSLGLHSKLVEMTHMVRVSTLLFTFGAAIPFFGREILIFLRFPSRRRVPFRTSINTLMAGVNMEIKCQLLRRATRAI